MPRTALKPTAAKTLKRSTIPKYLVGTALVPIAPTNIIANAIPAHRESERSDFSFTPAMIMSTSDTMESSTTT